MRNLHLIEVKYLGATNTRGSRVKLTSHRFGDSVTIPYDYEFNNAHDMAEAWLRKRVTKHSLLFTGEWKDGMNIIAIDVFERLKTIEKGGV